MRLYACMVLGGSICTLLYILMNQVLPYELSLKNRNLFLRINILFYLLPIPWMIAEIKGELRVLLDKAGFVFPRTTRGDVVHPNRMWESIIIRNQDNEVLYVTGYEKWIPIILAGCAVFGVLLAGWVIVYLTVGHRYKKDIAYADVDRYLKSGQDKKRKIRIGNSPYIDSPVTIGIIKPIILLPLNNEKYSASEIGIVCHELNHIFGMDGLFRFFTFMIIALEWYNPLAYYLFQENIAVSEMLCDEAAVRNMSKEEKTAYMQCIIAAVEEPQNKERVIMTLGASKSLTKERMKRIMGKNGKKVWKKGLAAGIMVLCVLLSSIPALAYQEPLGMEIMDEDSLEEWTDTTMFMAVREGSNDGDYLINSEMSNLIKTADFSKSEYVLVNRTGEIAFCESIELDNSNQTKAACSHHYEDSTVLKHIKNSDGSCTVVEYNAQKCSKCGDIKLGSEISRHTYKTCPHA